MLFNKFEVSLKDTDKFKILSSCKETQNYLMFRFTDKSSQNKFMHLSSTEYTKCSKYAYVYYTTVYATIYSVIFENILSIYLYIRTLPVIYLR